MQAAGFRNSLVPFASAILGHPLMKNVYAWTGGRAVLRPSGLAFPFPFRCSVQLLSSTLVLFPLSLFPHGSLGPWEGIAQPHPSTAAEEVSV